MKFHSTANPSGPQLDFGPAVIQGLAPDKGLYFPNDIPSLDPALWSSNNALTLADLGFEILAPFVGDSLSDSTLRRMLEETLSFDFPLVEVGNRHALELFHGPTCAFKDVGARFLARCIPEFSQGEVTVLVATSGDTGSAVAQGFHNVKGVRVVLLFPSGRISKAQELQLTTVGDNVVALEVDGAFDDCQSMVKAAFLNNSLQSIRPLVSANSINIARWIPQSIYYAWTAHRLGSGLTFSVPSGNYGNLAAGLLVHKMGMPAAGFIAATNANNVVPRYLETGEFKPRPSVATISNAMDVGDPSNFIRLKRLFGDNREAFARVVQGFTLDDNATREVIATVHRTHGYLLDPHGAIAYAALDAHPAEKGVFLGTAAPAKFADVIKPVVGFEPEAPAALAALIDRQGQSIKIAATPQALEDYLRSTIN